MLEVTVDFWGLAHSPTRHRSRSAWFVPTCHCLPVLGFLPAPSPAKLPAFEEAVWAGSRPGYPFAFHDVGADAKNQWPENAGK
jgi:hypothetical protein